MKRPTRDGVRFGFVADVHHGPNEYGKHGEVALDLLDDALAGLAVAGCDALVDLGDRITDTTPHEDLQRTEEVAALWRRARTPRHHVVGNHDASVPRDAAEHALGAPLTSHVTVYGDVRLVVWNASVRYPGLRIDDEDLNWLDRTLDASDAPTVIVSHVPLGGGSLVGNAYFEVATDGRGRYVDEAVARERIVRHPGVLACVAGHVHWNALHVIDGVAFLTLHGLTERFTTPPHASGAWATLDVAADRLRWEVRGGDPIRVDLPRRRPGHRWVRRTRGDPWPT